MCKMEVIPINSTLISKTSTRGEDTQHTRILRAEEKVIAWPQLDTILQQLEEHNNADNCQQVRDLLIEHVDGFKPQCEVEDWLV